MSARIGNLKDENGNIFYPITKTSAVLDNNNIDVETRLSNLENKSHFVKLWENPDPTQSIATLTVSVPNISQYIGFIVYYQRAIDNAIKYNATILVDDDSKSGDVYIPLLGLFGYTCYSRNVYFKYNDNAFYIANGYRQVIVGSGQVDGNKLIPVKLVGIID